ncbi:MAG: GGDEF domain-containing protein [Hyphomicrobiales bacterium]|nr:GGDEF domain-containing protein [Hyphomicrobiales bacterium]
MAKGRVRRGDKSGEPIAASSLRRPSADRRVAINSTPAGVRSARGESDPADAARGRADPVRLLAEVERLERELATARERMAALEAAAEVDPLTDVLNRGGFMRALTRALAHVRRYGTSAALLYVDLDGFKQVNDANGHAAGDAVLRAVSTVLTRHVRASDVVARLGGDEFGLLLWQLSEPDARRKGTELEAAVGRTTAIHAGVALAVGASAGVASLLPLDRPSDVLARADRDMYARKAARRTR